MAHHLAELIDNAEKGATAAERLRASKNASATIIKVWERRTLLPGNAYPLAPYKDALMLLDLLRPDQNPFRQFGRHAESRRDQLTAELVDGFSHLISILLLMKVSFGGRSAKVSSAATRALGKTEQHLLAAFQKLSKRFNPVFRVTRRASKGMKDGGATRVGLDGAALQLIEGTMTTLVELQKELQAVNRQSREPLRH